MKYNTLSHSIHYLHMLADAGGELSTGTGFIYEYDNIYYLITNGHNVTGINPENNEQSGSRAAYPTKIALKTWVKNEQKLYHYPNDFKLYEDTDFTKPYWYVHPIHEYKVDVVAIPIGKKTTNLNNLHPINSFFTEDYLLEVTDDIFIVGYPMNYKQKFEFPIWKRGSIATEPNFDWDNLPKFLIDAKTKQGMSGSLVFMRRVGIHNLSFDNLDNTEIGTIETFAGIYSGRINTDKDDVELGIVWKKQVIEEIIKGNKIGSIDFQAKYGY